MDRTELNERLVALLENPRTAVDSQTYDGRRDAHPLFGWLMDANSEIFTEEGTSSRSTLTEWGINALGRIMNAVQSGLQDENMKNALLGYVENHVLPRLEGQCGEGTIQQLMCVVLRVAMTENRSLRQESGGGTSPSAWAP